MLAVLMLAVLAGCMPVMPASSTGMFDQAQRMAATETGRAVQATIGAQATTAAQAQATQAAIGATSQAATAVMLRATEISAEATGLAIRDRAMQQHAEASVTAVWLNGQLTVIPVYLMATATRRAETARRNDQIEDFSAWALVWLVAAAMLGVAGLTARDVRAAWVDWVKEKSAQAAQTAQPAKNIDVSDLPVEVWMPKAEDTGETK